jgi:uncharacterized protein (DUF983 family)
MNNKKVPTKAKHLLASIFGYKCPKCRLGNLFVENLPTVQFMTMHERCQVCGQKTEPDPGFYYGAMFVSYIGTGFLYLGIIAFLYMVVGCSINQSFLILILFAIITYIPTFKLSRSIWIHAMVAYDKHAPSIEKSV